MDKQKEKLAILIPYRNRVEHLEIFVSYMNNYLKNNFENITYQIFIIEQLDDNPFNRGKLLNIGAELAKNYDYFILHDIDMLPISSDYSYKKDVFHLARNVYEQSNDSNLNLYYVSKELNNYAGGVLKIPKYIYYDINGFSNEYWGWGGEDDELKLRLLFNKYKILVINKKNHFITLSHKPNRNEETDEFIRNYNKSINSQNKYKNGIKFNDEGLSTLKYKLLKIEYNKYYIKYSVLL